jgi:hypothetical protein
MGPSPVWDSVEAAVTALRAETGRKTVIVVSDGRSTGNRHGLVEVANYAANAGVAINIVASWSQSMIRQGPNSIVNVKPHVLLSGLADYSGGVYREPAIAQRGIPKGLFADILATVRGSYTLGFRGMTDGKVHELEVHVKNRGLQVRVRKQYLGV